MPERVNINDAQTRAKTREMEKLREIRKIEKRAKSKKHKKVDLSQAQILKGDRTDNTPDLRKNSRQKMRIDKELSMNAYLVQESGKYWHEDVQMTLAVITHARMIIASRKERKHFVDDEGRKKGQIT